ncbi:MAG: hypothetical protein ACWA5K_05350, partial [bacterium]
VKKLSIDTLGGMTGAPTIHVYSSKGDKWDKIDETEATEIKMHLNAKCQFEGKGNKAYRGKMTVNGFTPVGDTEPANFLIPHASEAKGQFRYSGASGFNPVKVCNDELNKRLSEQPDKTKYHILAKGFSVDYPAAISAGYSLTCKPTGLGFTDSASRSIKLNARVKCLKSALAEEKIPKPKPKPKRAEFVPLVKDATFVAVPKSYTGTCPTSIEFKGKITVNRPGEVKYRIHSHDGKTSPTFTLKFTKAGTKPTGKWVSTESKPKASPSTTLSAGGANNPKWDFKGWQKLEIVSPEPKGSIVAPYQGKCTEKAVIRELKGVKPAVQLKRAE